MRCPCRPGWVCFFLFCLPLIFLTDSSSSETETGFLSSGFVAALRFVHNCPTRLQQGRFGVLPVLLPYLASKTANRGHTRAFLFPGHTLAHFPLWGKTDLFPILPCPGFPNLLTTGSHGFNGAGFGYCWCHSLPTRLLKPDTGPHRAEFSFTAVSCGALAQAGMQLPLQLVIYCLSDGTDSEKQGAVTHLTSFSAHLGWFNIDEPLFL